MIFGCGIDQDNGNPRVWINLGDGNRTLCECDTLEQCDLMAKGIMSTAMVFMAANKGGYAPIDILHFRAALVHVQKSVKNGGNNFNDPLQIIPLD